MDGFTYERAAITECGSEMGTPRRSRARATLESKRVTPNLTIVEQ